MEKWRRTAEGLSWIGKVTFYVGAMDHQITDEGVFYGRFMLWHPITWIIIIIGIFMSLFTEDTVQSVIKGPLDYRFRDQNKWRDE